MAEIITDKSVKCQELLEFDSTLSGHQRSDFLQFLFSKNRVFEARWTKAKLDADKKVRDEEAAEKEVKANVKQIAIAGYMVVSQSTGLACTKISNK